MHVCFDTHAVGSLIIFTLSLPLCLLTCFRLPLWRRSNLYLVLISSLCVLAVSTDTWMIHNRLGPDDYIMAAIELYLDIINLFIFILQLLNRRD